MTVQLICAFILPLKDAKHVFSLRPWIVQVLQGLGSRQGPGMHWTSSQVSSRVIQTSPKRIQDDARPRSDTFAMNREGSGSCLLRLEILFAHGLRENIVQLSGAQALASPPLAVKNLSRPSWALKLPGSMNTYLKLEASSSLSPAEPRLRPQQVVPNGTDMQNMRLQYRPPNTRNNPYSRDPSQKVFQFWQSLTPLSPYILCFPSKQDEKPNLPLSARLPLLDIDDMRAHLFQECGETLRVETDIPYSTRLCWGYIGYILG